MSAPAETTLRSGPVASLRFGRISPYWWLMMPALLLMAVFYLYPVLSVMYLSVVEPEPGLGNYALLFTDESIHRVLATTVRITLITTVVTLVLGYVVAYGLANATQRTRVWLMFGIILPLWVSVLIRSFAWITILRRQGVLNEFVTGVGLTQQPLDVLYNEFAVCVGMVHFMLPYAILPLYANMRTIDRRLVAAARSLGASRWTAFRRLYFPLSMPGILGASVLVFILSLGFYVTPAILGGGRVLMIAEYMSWLILDRVLWGPGTMLATILVATIVLLLVLVSRIVDIRKLMGAN